MTFKLAGYFPLNDGLLPPFSLVPGCLRKKHALDLMCVLFMPKIAPPKYQLANFLAEVLVAHDMSKPTPVPIFGSWPKYWSRVHFGHDPNMPRSTP